MAVVLVSRGSMSGGQRVADCLARDGGFTCITREHLVSTVNEYGGIASRLAQEIGKASHDYDRFTRLRRPYRILMKKALLEYASRDNLAYFGYSGHLLLGKTTHLVRVRLTAPVALRVQLTMERLGCSEKDAREYIRDADEERTRWARFIYGRDIRDPTQYDVCLNMERFSPAGVCSLLRELLRHEELQATPQSLRQIEDSRVATAILAALVTRPETFSMEIGATFEKGTARLEGPWLDPASLERVQAVVL
ncbi:MAG TPA: cytidylate kinase-like family protein, partial [Longimicrobiales bacterium]|nr:cytidylate kinase-like family protein [Longimicrobiales bacterium]